jgi:hypothetical protein
VRFAPVEARRVCRTEDFGRRSGSVKSASDRRISKTADVEREGFLSFGGSNRCEVAFRTTHVQY